MSVDLRKVKKLIELVEESGISELEVRDGDETIRIARHSTSAGPLVPAVPSAVVASAAVHEPARDSAGFEVRAPMAGTFYRAPDPDAEPFLSVGQAVEAGDVLCIIESMKMMNEIRSERAGVCRNVAVENGEPIGSGQVLFRFD